MKNNRLLITLFTCHGLIGGGGKIEPKVVILETIPPLYTCELLYKSAVKDNLEPAEITAQGISLQELHLFYKVAHGKKSKKSMLPILNRVATTQAESLLQAVKTENDLAVFKHESTGYFKTKKLNRIHKLSSLLSFHDTWNGEVSLLSLVTDFSVNKSSRY